MSDDELLGTHDEVRLAIRLYHTLRQHWSTHEVRSVQLIDDMPKLTNTLTLTERASGKQYFVIVLEDDDE